MALYVRSKMALYVRGERMATGASIASVRTYCHMQK